MATAPRRLYQVWKGSNRFFCGGRLIFGPDVGSLFLSTLLISGPALVFCAGVAPNIIKRDLYLGIVVLAVAVIITMWDLIFLFLTSGRDPGIVPRNTRPPESEETYDAATPSMEWINGRTPHLRLPRTKDVTVNGVTVKVKYCDTCLLYRPPRSSHCSICNNCVQKFDHHCPWVGQCIGLRNYRFFFLFISSSTFLCIYIFTFCWVNIIQHKHDVERKKFQLTGIQTHVRLWKAMGKEPLSVALVIYSFIAVWFVGGLTVFHLYLISTNQTTYENFRYRYDKKENPYNEGIRKNFAELIFSKIPPSLNDFRSWVSEDPIELRITTPNDGIDIMSQNAKIDIETGSKFEISGSMQVPDILRKLDYSGIDDDLKRKDGNVDNGFEAFVLSVDQEPIYPNQSHKVASETIDEEIGEGNSSNGVKDPINHNINILQPKEVLDTDCLIDTRR